MGERWKTIQNWPMYRVSNIGRVQSCWGKGGKRRQVTDVWHDIVPDTCGPTGYGRVTLYDGSRRYRELLHRLVLLAFIGPPPTDRHECRHLNGNRQDTRLENLAWGTPEENWQDRKKHGRINSTAGSRNNFSKVVESDVLKIRKLYNEGWAQAQLASHFNISVPSISMMVNRKTWRHI